MFGNFFSSSSKKDAKSSPWQALREESQLDDLLLLSFQQPVLIFKHSTRCSISSTALSRTQAAAEGLQEAGFSLFLLDLITYRSLSNQIASRLEVPHQSPQVLVVRNGKCIFDTSHMDIRPAELMPLAKDKLN